MVAFEKNEEPKQNIVAFDAYAWTAIMTVKNNNVTHNSKTNAD